MEIPQTDDYVQRTWLCIDSAMQARHLSVSARESPPGWEQSQLLGLAPGEAAGFVYGLGCREMGMFKLWLYQRALDVHTSTGLRNPRLPERTVESNQLTQF